MTTEKQVIEFLETKTKCGSPYYAPMWDSLDAGPVELNGQEDCDIARDVLTRMARQNNHPDYNDDAVSTACIKLILSQIPDF